jgi:hypothetical protein
MQEYYTSNTGLIQARSVLLAYASDSECDGLQQSVRQIAAAAVFSTLELRWYRDGAGTPLQASAVPSVDSRLLLHQHCVHAMS